MNQHSSPASLGASYDASTPAVVIHDLAITTPGVVAEAQRWSTGQRGPAASADEMAGADLSAFVTQAVTVGAQAIASAGGVQDTYSLEQLVNDVGIRTAESSSKAADLTAGAVTKTAKAVADASLEARKAITEADLATRKSFADSVSTAQKGLRDEIQRLVGGDNPELLDRLRPLLDTFSAELDARVGKQTGELLAKAARQFDPSDPTSPMAKHAAQLREQQDRLSLTLVHRGPDLRAVRPRAEPPAPTRGFASAGTSPPSANTATTS